MRTIICGGVGGLSLWIAIFPFDVLKSRIQISNSSEPMMKMLTHIARTEGKSRVLKRSNLNAIHLTLAKNRYNGFV